MARQKPAYTRVLLKLSGESLLGKQTYGIDFVRAKTIAEEIKEVHGLELLQKIIDDYSKKIEETAAAREKEILER